MILSDLREQVKLSVDRDDLDNFYDAIIEQAHHEVQVRKSWSAMRKKEIVTIASGDTTVPMPEDFKHLVADKECISLLNEGFIVPCYVYTEEKLDRLRAAWGEMIDSTQGSGRNKRLSVAVFKEDGQWFLSLPVAADADLQFRVSYYGYLPKLEGDNDETELTRDFPEMIIDKAVAIALKRVHDPEFATAAATYEDEFLKASKTDSYIEFAGRNRLT